MRYYLGLGMIVLGGFISIRGFVGVLYGILNRMDSDFAVILFQYLVGVSMFCCGFFLRHPQPFKATRRQFEGEW